jgi:hypothetical protein
MATNVKVQKVVNIATIAGASILVIGGAFQMTKAKGVKDFLFPALSILVGVSAFRYAMNHQKDVEKTSSASGSPAKNAAKVQYDSCNGRCGSGQRCVKGTCL